MTMPVDLFYSELGLEVMGIRLGVAALCGFVIGLDREIRNSSFGLRTTMLLAIGCAIFALIVEELAWHFAHREPFGMIDPSRVIQGIVGAIGFLGAGAIIRSRGEIKGGTTGATVWAVGGVGLASGFGMIPLALLGTVLILFVVTVLYAAERVVERIWRRQAGRPGDEPGEPG
jgi:putative Mg2+ transporter-C (MgtC) family protein